MVLPVGPIAGLLARFLWRLAEQAIDAGCGGDLVDPDAGPGYRHVGIFGLGRSRSGRGLFTNDAKMVSMIGLLYIPGPGA